MSVNPGGVVIDPTTYNIPLAPPMSAVTSLLMLQLAMFGMSPAYQLNSAVGSQTRTMRAPTGEVMRRSTAGFRTSASEGNHEQRSTLEQKDVGLQAGNPAKRMGSQKAYVLRFPFFSSCPVFLPVIVLAQSGGTISPGGQWTAGRPSAPRSLPPGGTIGQPDAGNSAAAITPCMAASGTGILPPAPPETPAAKPHSLPDTGFAPGRITRSPPNDSLYRPR